MEKTSREDGNCVYATVVMWYNVAERHIERQRRKTMTVGEQEFMTKLSYWLMEVAKELKKMNQLKAMELKAKPYENNITPEMVDDIMEGKNK